MSSLDIAFAFGASRSGHRSFASVGLALAMHGALSLGVHAPPRVTRAPPAVTEVELTSADAPPPPEPEHVEEPPAPSVTVPTTTAAASPPAVARAGALMTAKANAPPTSGSDEPVEFVTDPSGTTYGSGVVARGGTADHAGAGATLAGARPASPLPARPPGEGLVPSHNLSRRARLDEANACQGYFPSEADVDSGAVTVNLVVTAEGVVTSSSVVREDPVGQGFGRAARACLGGKRFQPALDKGGKRVATATTIRMTFVRE